MLNPCDLGTNFIAENCYKIKIDDLVRKAQKELKITLLNAQIEALGIIVNLTTSRTKFNGEKFWFICPNCNKRVGMLYKHPLEDVIGCRCCLNLKYKKQRFKGMIESLV
ncbi:MAG: hypothetical protein HYW86_03855 [Candidatus Roizmanbacteria bacterium]|nr:MAG: hypothetical protein HYW86_03855 [Candidatus Roizmanbacteria bacterium]